MFATVLTLATLTGLAGAATTAVPPELVGPIADIRAVGPEGAGNVAATAAWRAVVALDGQDLPWLLEAMTGANELAKNWLRAAVDTIAARELAAEKTLPLAPLVVFFKDRSKDPQARWLAYQWILRQDPTQADALAPLLLDDPSNPLRREGVARLMREAADFRAGQNAPGALARYQMALGAARDVDQIEAIAAAIRDLGEPVNLREVFGWVVDWRIIGPFDNTDRTGFERVFPPETELRAEAEYDGKPGKVRWLELRIDDAYGKLDFNRPLGAAKNVTAYAWAEFNAPAPGPAELRLGCKNAWKVWLNGVFVFGRDEYHRGAEIDQYRLPVKLQAGRNTILVKCCQNEEVEDWTVEWEFQLRVTDATGKPIPRQAADWRQFRGPHASGASRETGLDWELDAADAVAWQVSLPGRGLSSPIVVGNRVFLTAASGPRQEQLHVLCFDAANGALLWERKFWATGRTMCHEKTCVAAPSPASDGDGIYALFSSNDLIGLDLEGNLIWLRGLTRDYPNVSNSLGMSSSLLAADGVVVAQVENDSESYALGVEARTGMNLWRLDRPRLANWTSPVLLASHTPARLVALQSGKGVTAVELKTGRVAWTCLEGASTIPSIATAGDLLFVPSFGLTALEARSETGPPRQLWRSGALRPGTPSPVVFQDRVYVLNDAGVLSCGDARDGKRLWQLRLKGPISATPVAAENRMLVISEKGLAQVVDLSHAEGEVIAERNLGETILGSPAIAHGAIYVRSDRTLWKLGAKRP